MIGKIIELNDCHQPKQIKNFKNGAFIQDKRESIEKNNTSASNKLVISQINVIGNAILK